MLLPFLCALKPNDLCIAIGHVIYIYMCKGVIFNVYITGILLAPAKRNNSLLYVQELSEISLPESFPA